VKKILVIALLTFTMGISEVATGEEQDSIVGRWMKELNIEALKDYDILDIEFTKEGKYYAITVLEDTRKDTLIGDYTFEKDIITFKDDECKEVVGKYKLEFKDNGVDFQLIDDDCNRSYIIEGFFDKYKATLYD